MKCAATVRYFGHDVIVIVNIIINGIFKSPGSFGI